MAQFATKTDIAIVNHNYNNKNTVQTKQTHLKNKTMHKSTHSTGTTMKRSHHLLSFKSLLDSPQITSISGLQLVSHLLCITSQSIKFCFGILFYSLKQEMAMLSVNFLSMMSSDFQTDSKTRHVQTLYQLSTFM